MSETFMSVEFWFGAAVLIVYQFAKFDELHAMDSEFAQRSALMPTLRTTDFAGRMTYFVALGIFLATSLAFYFILCKISPKIMLGWAQISGAVAGEDLEKFVDSVNYPLFIAAAYIGLTQPGIPFLSNIGNAQRDMFHALMGVPTRVLNASGSFTNQIFARSGSPEQLARELQILTSDAWVQRIDAYADADFYLAHIKRLQLDEQAELLKATRRELKILVRQLVDVAALATVRESGVASLDRLADDLRVSMIPSRGWAAAFLAGGTLFLMGTTVLWILLPLLHDPAKLLLSPMGNDYWPKALEFSGQSIISQAGPIFLVTGIALAAWASAFGRAETAVVKPRWRPGMEAHFSRYAGLFVCTVVGVVLFDVFQAFFDYGAYKVGNLTGFGAIAFRSLPVYILHSFISLYVCFILLLYMNDNLEGNRNNSAWKLMGMVVGVSVLSFICAFVQIRMLFNLPFGRHGLDLAVVMVVINVSAALIAFACAALCKRHAETPLCVRVAADADRVEVDAPIAPALGGHVNPQGGEGHGAGDRVFRPRRAAAGVSTGRVRSGVS